MKKSEPDEDDQPLDQLKTVQESEQLTAAETTQPNVVNSQAAVETTPSTARAIESPIQHSQPVQFKPKPATQPSPNQPIRVRKPLPFDNQTGGRIIAKVCIPNRKPSPITGQKIGMPVAVQRPQTGQPRPPATQAVNRPVTQVVTPRTTVPDQRLVQPPVPKPRMVNRMVTPAGRPVNVRPIRPPVQSPVHHQQPVRSPIAVNHHQPVRSPNTVTHHQPVRSPTTVNNHQSVRSPITVNHQPPVRPPATVSHQVVRSPVTVNRAPMPPSPKKTPTPDPSSQSLASHPKGSLFAKGFKAINIGKNIVVKTGKPKPGQPQARTGAEPPESPTAPSPVMNQPRPSLTEPVSLPVKQAEPVQPTVTMTVPAQRFSQPVTETKSPSPVSKPVVKAVTSVVRPAELTKTEKPPQPTYQPVESPNRPAPSPVISPVTTPVKSQPVEHQQTHQLVPVTKPRPKVVHQKYPPPVPVEGLNGSNKGLPAIKTIKMANGETCGIKVQSPSVFAKVNLSTAKLREVKQQIAIQEAQKKKQRAYRVVKPPVRPPSKPEPTAVTVSVEDPNTPRATVALSKPASSPKQEGIQALPAPVKAPTGLVPQNSPAKPVSLLAKYGGQIVGTAKLKNDKLKSPVQRVPSGSMVSKPVRYA